RRTRSRHSSSLRAGARVGVPSGRACLRRRSAAAASSRREAKISTLAAASAAIPTAQMRSQPEVGGRFYFDQPDAPWRPNVQCPWCGAVFLKGSTTCILTNARNSQLGNRSNQTAQRVQSDRGQTPQCVAALREDTPLILPHSCRIILTV